MERESFCMDFQTIQEPSVKEANRKIRKKLICNQDTHPWEHLKKKDMAILGILMTGIQAIDIAIAVAILVQHFQRRDILRCGWHQFPWIWPIIPHTLLWILTAHGLLDQERQSEDSRNMRCIVSLHQSLVLATSLFCLPTLRWRRRFQKHTLHYDIITELCACNKSFVLTNCTMENYWESCTIHFPTKPPWSTSIDVLETNVRIWFSLPQMENWRMTVELKSEGR